MSARTLACNYLCQIYQIILDFVSYKCQHGHKLSYQCPQGYKHLIDQCQINGHDQLSIRAGRVPGGTIVLSRERTERSRTIPWFRKKNERLERVLKNIGMISKITERNRTERNRNRNYLKRTVKIVNAFLLSRTCSKLGTHFKSGMCS